MGLFIALALLEADLYVMAHYPDVQFLLGTVIVGSLLFMLCLFPLFAAIDQKIRENENGKDL
jgi:hypothetical protein